MTSRPQRIRDPVHGLIVFRENDPRDQLAWGLLNTPEFQRLRRIRQLGVSEFVFPGATHTRFAHCIGVFHTARLLASIVEREMKRAGKSFDRERADAAVIAALLHDLGHGPFSHTFEGVRRKLGAKKKHESWTAEIIRDPSGKVLPLLKGHRDGFAEEVAHFFDVEDPADIYHAIMSSSFDADRLDYLRRDKMMTGTGAGAIDFDWLMEHVRVAEVSIEAVDASDSTTKVSTFCLDLKALPAAEQFLLSRYTLHEQVYFHKTTRCVEAMIAQLLGRLAELAKGITKSPRLTGLERTNPLLRFFGKDGETLANYLALDDVVVSAAFERMTSAEDELIRALATRLRDRKLYKTLDVRTFGADEGVQSKMIRRIDELFKHEIASGSVIKDEDASVTIYTQIGGDEDRMHKKLHILDARGPREIVELSSVIKELAKKQRFVRYYFAKDTDRDRARALGEGRMT